MTRQDARSFTAAVKEALRKRAVAGVESGRTQVEVAEVFGVTRQAVGRWIKAYHEGGERALRAKRQGRPRGGSLTARQQKRIARMVIDNRPDQLKLSFFLWTREAVSQLIEEKVGLSLSIWTVGRYLKRWGFTTPKPIRRAFEQSPREVEHWLQVEYPRIKAQAALERAEIFWGDEMGLRSDHASGRTYGLGGCTPQIPITGNRFGCNMISALTNRGRLYFMIFDRQFKAEVFLDFLRRLIRQAESKVFLIVDGHPVHRSGKVKKWLKNHEQELHLFRLPAYSPELNPDEYLNQDVKSNAVGRLRTRDKHHLMSNLRNFLKRKQGRPHLVRKYFQAYHVQYAA
jgi:transposase